MNLKRLHVSAAKEIKLHPAFFSHMPRPHTDMARSWEQLAKPLLRNRVFEDWNERLKSIIRHRPVSVSPENSSHPRSVSICRQEHPADFFELQSRQPCSKSRDASETTRLLCVFRLYRRDEHLTS